MKLSRGRFRLDMRKGFLTQIRHCNRLSREVVTAPSLTDSKKGLDNTLSHMM